MLSTQTASVPEVRAEPAREEATWDTTLVRCVATMLIANSHLEAFYPRSWLAADGLLGNTMFFMVSGLGLTLGSRAIELPFFRWYLRRVLRIYPALWVCMVALEVVAGRAWAEWSLADYVTHLVWPTDYPFVRDVMIYYAIAYVLLRWWQGGLFWALGSTAVPTVAIALHIASTLPPGRLAIGAIPIVFWLPFWLLMFLAGMALPRLRIDARARGAIGWLLAGSFVLYIAIKYAMVVGGVLPRAFLLLFSISTVVGACAIVAGARSDWIQSLLSRGGPAAAAIRWLGGLSLEVYLTHWFVMARPEIVELWFPLNVAVFAVCTLALSYATNRLAAALRRTLEPQRASRL